MPTSIKNPPRTYTRDNLMAGAIVAFASGIAVDGFALCNGAVLLKTQYSELYHALGDAWATCTNPLTGTPYVQPDSSYFRLPDLRGTFLRGAGAGLYDTTALAQWKQDQFQQFQVGIDGAYLGQTTGAGSSYAANAQSGYAAVQFQLNAQSATGLRPFNDGTNGTPRMGLETRPNMVGVNYYIKLYSTSVATSQSPVLVTYNYPVRERQYVAGVAYANGTPTVTSTLGSFTVNRARFVPKKTSDGAIILEGTIDASSVNGVTWYTVSISGISFYSRVGVALGVASGGQLLNSGVTLEGTGNIEFYQTGSGGRLCLSFTAELTAWPTWADAWIA